jgi:hypothetical protein
LGLRRGAGFAFLLAAAVALGRAGGRFVPPDGLALAAGAFLADLADLAEIDRFRVFMAFRATFRFDPPRA